MLNSGIVIVYCLRVNMSVAAQDMRDELNWSESEKGLALVSRCLYCVSTYVLYSLYYSPHFIGDTHLAKSQLRE